MDSKKKNETVYIIAATDKYNEFKGFVSKNYYGKYILNNSKSDNVKFMTESAATNFIYHNYSFLKDIVGDEDRLFIIPTNYKEEVKVHYV